MFASANLPTLFHKLAQCRELTESALGKFIGKKLYNFVSSADQEHPETVYAFMDIFNSNDVFCHQIEELLYLYENCSYMTIANNFHKLIDRSKFSKRFLGVETYAPYAPRVLPPKDLIAYRKGKTTKKNSITPQKKGEEFWIQQPNNFDQFRRGQNPYDAIIETSEEKAGCYFNLGCEVLAQKILGNVKQVKEYSADIYYGFNRINIVTASTILAKYLGYSYNDSFDIYIQPIEQIKQYNTKLLEQAQALDRFVEANKKPIFDDFIVLSLVDTGLYLQTNNCWIMLGERDGKCYFL